ncbi:uncharacterized protein N7518_000104 [Penicillium psychrosexuale]|uniref:uncharacterized protein n=1 Tax=Penicillium psychrosexuale TaxID=1002107 RepID=UPI0025457A3D|nr:uncharacterized protein N7518_000104 [Penicillium psychrosexuale]KAJ5803801.1 hypothetical protein N7518_000104 [Penicillium psychrosexuale]
MYNQVPSFQPVRFIPSAEKEDMLNSTVLFLYAVGHQPLSEGGNHWCLYLGVGDGRSVCIDATPSYNVPAIKMPGGLKAFMLISLLSYIYSELAEKAVKIQVRTGTKVKDFIDLLLQHNRHRAGAAGIGRTIKLPSFEDRASSWISLKL